MTPPQPPYGQPQQPGQQPGYPPPQGYPQQQAYPQQPGHPQPQAGYPQGYPQQQFPQQGYPQQPQSGSSPKAAYVAGAVSAVAALISLIFAIGYIDNAIGTMGGITGETNAGINDALYWVTSVVGLLTALGIAASAAFFFLRHSLAPLAGMISGGLGVIMMGFRVATALHAEANRGSTTGAADVEYVTVLVLALIVLAIALLPPVKGALKPKAVSPGNAAGFPMQGPPQQAGYPSQGALPTELS